MLDVRSAMRNAATYNATRTAIVCNDWELTFGEAWGRGVRMANALLAIGLEPGDRIAVLEDNCLESSDIFLGAAIANLVRVPLYRRNAPVAHAQMMRSTACRAVVVSAEHLPEIDGVLASVPSITHRVVRDSSYESWLKAHSCTDPDVPIKIEDPFIIRHSGGTTGVPKGMLFSHHQWMTIARDWTYMLPKMAPGEAMIHAAPVSHGSGYFFMPTWLMGGCNVLMAKFDPEEMLRSLEGRGGFAFVVPTMLHDLVRVGAQKTLKFEKLRALIVAGAPIRPQTALAARDMFGDVLHQFYGQTEATPVAWMTSHDWFNDVHGSVPLLAAGRIMPFSGVEVRDTENRQLGVNEVGELALRADGQIREIWGQPDTTEQRIVDGWVLSGDIGRIDENGFLYLVDRKDDMIISGGLNIWPAELELVISALPGVQEVAVVAKPDSRWGESPAAVVVVNEGAQLSEDDVIRACIEQLGSYKKPAIVILQKEGLPRSLVGKIQRKEVRARFWTDANVMVGGS